LFLFAYFIIDSLQRRIDLKTAYALYENLKTAQKHLILIDNLHLLSCRLVTVYLKSLPSAVSTMIW